MNEKQTLLSVITMERVGIFLSTARYLDSVATSAISYIWDCENILKTGNHFCASDKHFKVHVQMNAESYHAYKHMQPIQLNKIIGSWNHKYKTATMSSGDLRYMRWYKYFKGKTYHWPIKKAETDFCYTIYD